jgi:hypothetical protein
VAERDPAMTDDNASPDVFRTLSDAWQDAMDKDDFYAAIAAGIAAYFALREQRNEQMAKGALNLIQVAISSLLNRDGITAPGQCSFCNRRGLNVFFGTNSNTFICAACIRIFHDALDAKGEP